MIPREISVSTFWINDYGNLNKCWQGLNIKDCPTFATNLSTKRIDSSSQLWVKFFAFDISMKSKNLLSKEPMAIEMIKFDLPFDFEKAFQVLM